MRKARARASEGAANWDWECTWAWSYARNGWSIGMVWAHIFGSKADRYGKRQAPKAASVAGAPRTRRSSNNNFLAPCSHRTWHTRGVRCPCCCALEKTPVGTDGEAEYVTGAAEAPARLRCPQRCVATERSHHCGLRVSTLARRPARPHLGGGAGGRVVPIPTCAGAVDGARSTRGRSVVRTVQALSKRCTPPTLAAGPLDTVFAARVLRTAGAGRECPATVGGAVADLLQRPRSIARAAPESLVLRGAPAAGWLRGAVGARPFGFAAVAVRAPNPAAAAAKGR